MPCCPTTSAALDLFVAVEGIDGSGKSGVVAVIAELWRAQGHDPVVTREPGGTPQGEALRALLLAGQRDRWDPASELLLMTAARVEHVRRVIAPALAENRHVVTDRFVASSFAYQGAGQGLDARLIRDLHANMLNNLTPDLTILLDVPTEIGLARSRKRLATQTLDEGRFERFDTEFYARVRQNYLDQASEQADRFITIDATKGIKAIHKEVSLLFLKKRSKKLLSDAGRK